MVHCALAGSFPDKILSVNLFCRYQHVLDVMVTAFTAEDAEERRSM